MSKSHSFLLGYVLSGSTSSRVVFEPLAKVENRIREGQLVVINTRKGRKLLGTITRIVARHEFYEPGGVWTEAIRRGELPPLEVARKYLVARVQVYGVLTSKGLATSDQPPEPGDKVYEAAPEDLVPLYGYVPSKGLPEDIIEIGVLYGYSGDIVLPASLKLNRLTMHFAVLGVTGSGKSNTMGVIIEELGSKNGVRIGNVYAKTIPVMVFDANGDYLDYYDDSSLVLSYRVVRLVFRHMLDSIPERPGTELYPIHIDLNVFYNNPSELAEAIYSAVRGGGLEGLELQLDLLTRALDTVVIGIAEEDKLTNIIQRIRYICRGREGVDLNRLLGEQRCMTLLVELIDNMPAHTGTRSAVARTVRAFYDLVKRYELVALSEMEERIDEEFIDQATDLDEPMFVIFDFSPDGAAGVDLRIKQFIVYYVVRLLLQRFTYYKTEGKPRIGLLVVEEAQNYIPNQREYPIGYSVARSYLALAATQGRKFGLSLALVTQRPGFVDPVVLSMMNTFIIHRVSSGDVRFVQLATGGLPSHIASTLPLLETGVAVITGQMSPFPYPVLALIRRRRSHRAGSI